MLHWHDDAGLVMQGAFPCMHVSKCWTGWSNRGLERKRSIPLAFCMQELLDWGYTRLAVDEDYVYALQASARARMGGARQQNVFLLMCKARAWRHAHMAAFDSCGSCRLTLTPFLAHFSIFSFIFLFIFFFLYFFFASFFPPLFFFNLSFSFSFFLRKQELILL